MRSGQGNTELEHKFLFGGKKAFNQKKKSCASKYMQMGKNTGKKTRTTKGTESDSFVFFSRNETTKIHVLFIIIFCFFVVVVLCCWV
jgi:hypothetical protein